MTKSISTMVAALFAGTLLVPGLPATVEAGNDRGPHKHIAKPHPGRDHGNPHQFHRGKGHAYGRHAGYNRHHPHSRYDRYGRYDRPHFRRHARFDRRHDARHDFRRDARFYRRGDDRFYNRGVKHNPQIRDGFKNVRDARKEVQVARSELRKDYAELRKDRLELRRDIRNGASKEEILKGRQEIRQDWKEIAQSRQDLRETEARLAAARQQLKTDMRDRPKMPFSPSNAGTKDTNIRPNTAPAGTPGAFPVAENRQTGRFSR